MKTTEKVEMDFRMQQGILTYCSDYNLLSTNLYQHLDELDMSRIFIASLDHAMWFHRDFDFNDWLLYNISSPSASNSRGMGAGRIFTRDGRLAATVMQEGLIREIRKKS